MLELVDAAYDSDEVQVLVAEVQEEYVRRYGGPDDTPLAPGDFTAPRGAFVLARVAGEPVGCAGVRHHGPGVGELKRLYVRAGHRRAGYGSLLLAAAEQRARALGCSRMVLETGTEQPEAVALYLEQGYGPVEAFGRYACSPRSRHFAKDL